MAQFGSGKAPPPWQTRNQAAAMQTSLLGQHPTGALTNQQLVLGAQTPYAALQQSIIQPPGLGGLQALVQPNISQQQSLGQPGMAQATICQPNMAQTVQAPLGQPNMAQANLCQAAANLMVQPPMSTQSMQANLAPHNQLNTVAQMQPQATTVAYPAPRSLPPPGAFVNQGVAPNMAAGTLVNPLPVPGVLTNMGPVPGVNNVHGNSNVPPQKQRVFTGTITKLCADFGFVDEDVFFQTSCVKGVPPKVGERVLVEASFNPNMPFKWNANRVQVIPGPMNSSNAGGNSRGPLQSSNSGRSNSFNAVPPPSFNIDGQNSRPIGSRARSPRRDRRDDLKRGSRCDNRMDRDDKDKDNKIRKRSRDRSRSPLRKRPRVFPRYNVQIPNIMLHMKEANVLELRKRYASLYIPSDVFLARPLWSDTFPPHRCFQFPRPVSFHILSKEVESVFENDAVYDPPDANHSFAAKVMLMAVPSMEDIYRRSCALSEDPSDVRSSFVHPTRLINFLVGLKGKNETMAIGGYWSPSLDGQNPERDDNVLIRTAIRTCKALTGIDLSGCTTWYRFAEIYYRRGEFCHKGRNVPVRVETTVLFLPDVWNICPTKLEWDGLQVNYRRQLDRRLQAATGDLLVVDPPVELGEPDEEGGDHKEDEKKDPTYWSNLDPKTLKVVDLRNELNARLLNSKGLKSQLIARLTKALKLEQEKEEQEKASKAETDNAMKKDEENKRKEEERRKRDDEKRREDEERKKTEERERCLLEKRYTLPEQPMLLVHPSKTAKSGKFDCTTMSLSVLLDYRQEDNKEHSFEVSLFAELFNEMLMRDFAFRIYKSIVQAPDKNKDEKKDKDKKDDKEDRKKEEKDDKKEKKPDKEEEKDDKKEDEFEEEDIEEYFDEEIVDEDDSKELPRHEKEKDRKKDTRKEKGKREKKLRKKMVTIDPHLLLSFVYFDQAHTGYIIDKDLEDIINILGVNPSRAQLKKLIAKVLSRDALYYRRLTDVSEDEKDKKRELPSVDVEQLSSGNNSLLPMLCDSANRLGGKNENGADNSSSENGLCPSSGVIKFEGSIIDVGKLMQQLHRSEKARNDTEDRLKEVQKELITSKEDGKRVLEKHIKLCREVKYTNVNLKATEEELKKVQEDNTVYQKAIHQVRGIISPLVPIEDTDDDDLFKTAKMKEEQIENGT